MVNLYDRVNYIREGAENAADNELIGARMDAVAGLGFGPEARVVKSRLTPGGFMDGIVRTTDTLHTRRMAGIWNSACFEILSLFRELEEDQIFGQVLRGEETLYDLLERASENGDYTGFDAYVDPSGFGGRPSRVRRVYGTVVSAVKRWTRTNDPLDEFEAPSDRIHPLDAAREIDSLVAALVLYRDSVVEEEVVSNAAEAQLVA